jgi:hypothetical protein
MALIILLPAVACWIVIARWSMRRALLDVYLPSLLLLPQYYILRAPHLPPLTFAQTAILPLGLAFLVTGLRGWRLNWMDLAVFLFAASAGISEGWSSQLADRLEDLSAPASNPANGVLAFIGGLLTIVLPYMAGKLLIERRDAMGENMRGKFVARMAVLLAVVAAISVRDFLTVSNSWIKVGAVVFPRQFVPWLPQMRWGFGRIAGPYGHAILAGMIFLTGIVYCLWLCRVDPRWGARRIIDALPVTGRGLLIVGMVAGLLMTQSRGPWMGMGLALVFAALTRIFPLAKAAALFTIVLVCFSAAAYYVGIKYTDKDLTQATTVEQRDAIYRRELLPHYIPLVKERPAFGWGLTTYPKVAGQDSIDNEYLLLAVTQGLFGLGLYLAVAAGSAARLMRLLGRPMGNNDRWLIFAHLSVLIGLMATLTTVYMGEQVVMLFFLFAGWVQGMNPVPVRAEAMERFAGQWSFRRVLA